VREGRNAVPSSQVCVDASFVLRMLVDNGSGALALQIWSRWLAEGRTLVAPALLYYEVTNALHRYAVLGHLAPEESSELLGLALKLDITAYDEPGLHYEALRLAQDVPLPAAYDAHYLVLAYRLGAEFWTADARLFRLVSGCFDWVQLLESGAT